MNIVINSTTKNVIQAGECSVEFDPAKEELIVMDFVFNPGLGESIWKYDSYENTFIVDELAVKKRDKINSILEKTIAEESVGAPYSGHKFSVSAAAKPNWLALIMAKDTLTYPWSAPTGYGEMYGFQSANDILGFFAAAMGFLNYWESSNEQLIIAINACTTVEQVDAIVDDRAYPPA
jgi:hypothetical protein